MRCPNCGSTSMTRDDGKRLIKDTGIVCLICDNCHSIYTESQVEEYWDTQSEARDVNYSAADRCESCGQSLSRGVRSLPWEDGNNADAYIRCPYCGHKNIRYGFGDDD